MSESTSEPLLPALHPATISGPAPEPEAAPSTDAGAAEGGEGKEGAEEGGKQTPEQKAAAEQAAAQERQKKSAAARIGAAVRAQREAERERDKLADRVRELEASKDPAKAAEQLAEAQIDLKAAEKARQMLAADTARQKAEAFQGAGEKDFADDWNDKCNSVAGIEGANRKDFVPILLDLDNGHRAVAALDADHDLAKKILAMPSHKMAIELQKLADKAAEPPKKPVSKAPEPIGKARGVARSDGYRSDFTVQEHLDWVKKNQPYRP